MMASAVPDLGDAVNAIEPFLISPPCFWVFVVWYEGMKARFRYWVISWAVVKA